MSVDFNSIITRAAQESVKRRSQMSALNAGLLNPENVAQSGRSSELSMEDIVGAMKAKNAEKKIDNKFVEQYGKAFKIHEDEEIKNPTAENVQAKIEDIKAHSAMALDRQADIAKSLKAQHKNPYVK